MISDVLTDIANLTHDHWSDYLQHNAVIQFYREQYGEWLKFIQYMTLSWWNNLFPDCRKRNYF